MARETGGLGIPRRAFARIAKYGLVAEIGEGYGMNNNGMQQSSSRLHGAIYGAGSTLLVTRTDPGATISIARAVFDSAKALKFLRT